MATITVDMGSATKAKRAYQALLPETKSRVTGRSRVTLEIEGRKLTLKFKASDISALRASVNSY
jgi:tRNA threonylcarbamoyladenosine modification (KEOPS) complex  Pcc1 subunit